MPPDEPNALLGHSEQSFEWRAVVLDAETNERDFEGPFATRAEAEGILPALMNAEPPYDECWIERRPCVDWERVADA